MSQRSSESERLPISPLISHVNVNFEPRKTTPENFRGMISRILPPFVALCDGKKSLNTKKEDREMAKVQGITEAFL